MPPAQARVFDDLYAAVAAGEGISGALLRTLNETNKALLPELTRLQLKVAQSQIERQAKQKVRPARDPVTCDFARLQGDPVRARRRRGAQLPGLRGNGM